ncbi:MAG: hypothetical protein IKK04_03375 [Bacteroidales bacterium]|nr:hypothetical protein [Bacteroidales bacterium]
MPLVNTKERFEEEEEYVLSFSMEGNKNGADVKIGKGDGEVNTSDKKGTGAKLTANLQFIPNEHLVRLCVHYVVEEFSGDQTTLYFDATQDYPIGNFFNKGIQKAQRECNDNVKKKCTSTLQLVGTYPQAYIYTQFSGQHHDYMTPNPWNQAKVESVYATQLMLMRAAGRKVSELFNQYISVPQPWIYDIKMKVDDKGNDATGSGNIGVSGTVKFRVKRIDNIDVTTMVKEEKPIQTSTIIEPTFGSEKILDSIPDTVFSVLGRGYDICGHYADFDSVHKETKILNIEKLNKYKRLNKVPVYDGYHESNYGEGLEDYSEKIATNITASASIVAYGGFLKAETKRSFNVESAEKFGYKYASYMSGYKDSEYVVFFHSPNQLMGFLDDQFLEALNILTADEFIERYGTHVIVGMALGSRFTFSMRYQESTRKHSEAYSIKDSASIGYKDNGEVAAPEKPISKSESEKIFDAIMKDNVVTPEELTAWAKYLEATKGAKSEKPSNGGGGGQGNINVELGATYGKDESWSLLQEDKSTTIKCLCVGGDAYLCQLINDTNNSKYYEEWVKSNRTNCTFCDFTRKGLLPIYELIPSGYKLTAQAIKQASEDYQYMNSVDTNGKLMRAIEPCDFNTLSESNTENKQSAKSSDHDDEIGTKTGKKTYWEMHIELLNLDGGHCGFNISLTVKEGGEGGGASILQNHFTKEIPLKAGLSEMSIDTDYFGGRPTFEAHGTVTGQQHGWFDVTSDVLNGTAGNILCQKGNKVLISIDDKGSDLGHIGVQGTIMVPWIGY